MTARRVRWLVAGQAVVIVVLLGLLAWRHQRPALPATAPATAGRSADPGGRDLPAGAADDDGHGPEAPGSVRLPAQVQQSSGILLARLRAAHAPPSGEAWGQVLGAQPLADARLRLRQAAADAGQYEVALAQSRREQERLDALWADGGNVARRQVDQAHADLAQLEQRQMAARGLQEAVRASVRAEWGDALLRELELVDGGAVAGVLAGSQRLLLLPTALPGSQVAPAGRPELHLTVHRLAPAPQSLAGGAQPTWYWLGPAEQLRAGQRVQVLAAPARQGASGVEVPEAAVVWQSGQSWVWQPDGTERFRRVAVTLSGALPGGWFAGAPLAAGQLVVVGGAQLLLSEESRALIRNENGD